jgi:hypothetical protein
MSFGETFLRYPDLFPARRAGEPWGDRELVLDLPGGPYRFSGLSREQEAAALGRFGSLRLPDSASAVDTALFRAAADDFREVDVRGWEYGMDFDSGPSSVRLAGLDLLGRLDWRPALSGALWTPVAGGERFPGIFENFCRVLVAYRLHELGGAVIHGAALLNDGGALLFAGRSGAGKTTVSRMGLEQGRTVLSDDLNALLPDRSGGVLLAGLPFTGDLGSGAPGTHPLRALLRLEKDTGDALLPLGRAEAAACLMACSPFLNADAHRHGALLSTLLALVDGVPAFALRFSLTGRMWSILP